MGSNPAIPTGSTRKPSTTWIVEGFVVPARAPSSFLHVRRRGLDDVGGRGADRPGASLTAEPTAGGTRSRPSRPGSADGPKRPRGPPTGRRQRRRARGRSSNGCRGPGSGRTRKRGSASASLRRHSPSDEEVRRCPTLPRGPPRSTIGAESLSFRVRNGTGRFPLAMAAETLWMFRSTHPAPGCGVGGPDRLSGTTKWTRARNRCWCCQVVGLLVPVSCTGL